MPTDFTGKIFGSYKLVAQLGRGGMAAVYRGYQESIDRSVAVKVLPPEFLHDPNFTARFLTEARTLAKLTHPSILPLYDFGTANDVPYIVMPLMPNGTLADRLGQGPLAPAEVVRVLTPVAAALDYAHTQAVLHRDVKPSNILFDQHNTPFLADFGIAKALEATSGLTGTGVVGTPDYMSPEQARGEQLDGRSDLYSLGVVVFQCLTGTQLFKATTPLGVMLKHATEAPPPVRASRPDLPQAVEEVVQKSLAKYPNERYQTASAFIGALSAASTTGSSATVVEPKIADYATMVEAPARTGSGQPRTTVLPASGKVATPPTAAPPVEKKGGVGGVLLGGGVGMIVGIVVILGVVICLCAGLYALSVSAQSTPTPPPTVLPTTTPVPPTPTPVPYLLFDDFSDPNSGWSTFTGDSSTVQYSNGQMAIAIFKTEWFAWSNPESNFSDVYIEVTAINSGGASDTFFGIMCDYQNEGANYYYAGIDSNGRYAILKYDGQDTWLTGKGDWARSDLIVPNAESYRLGFGCGQNVLTLYVNGQLIDKAADSTYSSGDVGLFVWTIKQAKAEVRFDDFAVVELP